MHKNLKPVSVRNKSKKYFKYGCSAPSSQQIQFSSIPKKIMNSNSFGKKLQMDGSTGSGGHSSHRNFVDKKKFSHHPFRRNPGIGHNFVSNEKKWSINHSINKMSSKNNSHGVHHERSEYHSMLKKLSGVKSKIRQNNLMGNMRNKKISVNENTFQFGQYRNHTRISGQRNQNATQISVQNKLKHMKSSLESNHFSRGARFRKAGNNFLAT